MEATPSTPPAAAPPAASPVPPAAPQAPVPPQAPAGPPVDQFADGGQVNGKPDWVNWILLGMAVATLGVISYYYIIRAKQSRKLADNQESTEAKISAIEAKLVRPVSPYSSLGLM